MIQRLPCTQCGDLIHPDTAAANSGLCMPCKRGYRQRIEESKRQREREREYAKSAEALYWQDLVRRVHETPEGFAGLRAEEQTYFAVGCLVGEVYNGGFDQFFSSSSGAYYSIALNGLRSLGATASTALLRQAKHVLFGDRPVPLDRQERLALMTTSNDGSTLESQQLDAVDKAFWADPDKLDERSKAYAFEHRLFSPANRLNFPR